jgi:precorrin-6B C5,15-methyltransferase / cobalt-precorrin-6B C5,C15-methyltransferase
VNVPALDRVHVIGLVGGRLEDLPAEARRALGAARVVVGGRRHLAWWKEQAPAGNAEAVRVLEIGADADAVSRDIARLVRGGEGPVTVLASGDPGFFGMVRALLQTIDRHDLCVIPAPSSVSLAFARCGLPWDDAAVVSAHGRPLADALDALRVCGKVAVLTSPTSPPEALGAALLAGRNHCDCVVVCSHLGEADETVQELSVQELADGRFDPLSVVVLVGPGGLPLTGWSASAPAGARRDRVLAFGLPANRFAHRDGMITKDEARAVVLSKLALPATGVLWDVGAGSGSVGVECALVQPGLTVLAIESAPEAAAQIAQNASAHGVGLHVITGHAPEALADLPAPDRVFVGGGGLPVLRVALERLAPAGRIVATYAALDRAAVAADLLGHLVQVGVDAGRRLPDGSWRLEAHNPVFIAWGPGDDLGSS